MPPVPQPKPLDDIFEKLQRCLYYHQPLGDIDKFTFKQRLEEQLAIDPINAHTGLGILAVCEGKETLVHQHFAMTLTPKIALSSIYYNYALALAHMGYTEEAIEQLRLALNASDVGTMLDKLAGLALPLGADELIPEILEKARKLKVKGPMLMFAAVQMGLAYEGNEEAYIARMDKLLPDEGLREHSVPLTDERWQEMCDFANSLRQYV